MDGPHYPANVINTSSASYPSQSAITPHQLQHQGAPIQQHTLPPLHQNNPAMQQPYGSYPHTPRTPATPNTPGSANTMPNYPPPPQQNAGRGGYQMMPNNPYQQGHQQYTSSAMLPPASTASAQPQGLAAAPNQGGRVPPVLRPMPAGGMMAPQPGLNSPYAQSPMMQQPPVVQDAEQPTHVVGSQGRRGVLPSAPGRPQAITTSNPAAKNQIPQKDADGKFPCPHCTKTYLHAKHLKRHLLRHTGDRPYMCVLCRDTFSRSDILKRHFQKCSIRRGNPTGASHLSHPQAHVKKSASTQKNGEGDMNHMNGMGNMPPDGTIYPFGLIPASDATSNVANDQSQLSRSDSVTRADDANRDIKGVTRSAVDSSPRSGGYDQSYNRYVSDTVTANINPQLANYSMPPAQNGVPMYGGPNPNQPQSGLDWSQMFQPGAQDTTYVNTFPPNVGQTPIALKQEPDVESARPDGISGNSSDNPFFPKGARYTDPDPYQQLSTQILNFFHPPSPIPTTSTTNLNHLLQPANIKDFLDKYNFWHVHFPMLHIPTFSIKDAYVGLIAGMCCVGACYSNRVSPANVREMMNFLKHALEGHSRLLSSLSWDVQGHVKLENAPISGDKTDIEELQAIMLMEILFLWHGTPVQREQARRTYPLIASLARKIGLLRVSDPSAYNTPHQANLSLQTFHPPDFNWIAWVEQEKRIRLMYIVFLFDTALGLYFNTGPEFDPFEVQLPLPSDDAAWDAWSPAECAQALGLRGEQAARERNSDGTRRYKQPEMHLALQALLHSSYQIQPGTTNLYGKFILIHAILSMIRRAQTDATAAIMLGSTTPLTQNDWIIGRQDGSRNPSANNSGRATPVDGLSHLMLPQTYKAFCTALDKFKSNWDLDMATQFPPSVIVQPRRYGFCRDGVHFYWLANFLLKNTRPSDLQMPPDQRFTHVIHLLKSVKNWVMTDGASRGEELGSVGDIKRDFGLTDLTLDMAQLFTPLPQVVESSEISSVQTDIGTSTGGHDLI